MKVAIVVLSFNSRKYIAKCINSLQKLKTSAQTEIIIVDSDSSDNSAKFLREKFSTLTHISSSNNLGYAGGNNLGLRYALDHGADYIWIVNPDVIVAEDSLDLALKEFKDSKIGVVGSKVYFAKGFEFHKDKYSSKDLGHIIWYAGGHYDWQNVASVHEGINEVDHGQFEKRKEVESATGASLLVRAATLRQSGLIDEKYFLYFEENDLCQRIRKIGWKILYVPSSVVWHQVGQATGIGSELADYYTTRNQLLFGLRWAPWRAKLALFRQSIRLVHSGRPWQKRGVIDFYLGRFGIGSYVK